MYLSFYNHICLLVLFCFLKRKYFVSDSENTWEKITVTCAIRAVNKAI